MLVVMMWTPLHVQGDALTSLMQTFIFPQIPPLFHLLVVSPHLHQLVGHFVKVLFVLGGVVLAVSGRINNA